MDRFALRKVQVRVVPVPSRDLEFVQFVDRCLAAGALEIGALEASLRRRYPTARVRPNELSGRDAVWYAYRDGHWQPAPPTDGAARA